jgi:DNA-binding transcriptional LysR family regulator
MNTSGVPHAGPLTLRQLRLLLALNDHGTVTAAARAEGVTQPALSQSLRALERRFGVALVRKVGRRLVFTGPAQVALEYARRIVRLTEEAEAAVSELAGLRRGTLTVGASTIPGTYLLPRLLGAFRMRHPEIQLGLRIGDTRDVAEWVRRGVVDFGVIGETRENIGLTQTPFRRDELVVVTPASHPLAGRRTIDAESLAATPLILREPGSSTRETLERALAAAGRTPTVLFELGGTEAILEAVAAGLGASVVSELAVRAGLRARSLRVRRASRLDLTRFLAIVAHPDARPGPAAAVFLSGLLTADASGPSFLAP